MSKVARQLKFLNKISSTTTDAQVILSPGKYQRLSLTFQTKNHNGHMGARKFWKDYLPTIQFYNPQLRIDVTRIKNESKTVSVPCTLQANKHAPEILQSLLQKLDHERVPESQIISVGTQSA